MGSWNNTCGLTNLPIHAGEAVYVFPINEKDLSKYRSHCYSHAFYKPMIIPFTAEYNDYGAGENCTGISFDLFIEEMRRELVELEVGENEYHDIAVKREGFGEEQFFEAVHEDRLFVKGWGTTDRPVYFTMVRKDVADRMWNEWSFDMWKGSKGEVPAGFEFDEYYIKNVTYAKLATLVPKFLSELSEKIKELTNDELMIDRYISRSLLMRDNLAAKFLLEGVFRTLENYDFWDLLNAKECIIKYIETDQLDKAEEFIHTLMIGCMVNSMMESTRRIWLPVMHMGSQSEEHAEYRLLHKLANDVINARDAYYDEENGEDDLFTNAGIYLLKDRVEQD